MVDLKHSITHREPHYSATQLVEEDFAAVVKVLVVDTYRQDKMKELPDRHALAPWHFGTRLECIIDIVQMKLGRIICYVGKRHIGIHELHGLTLFRFEGSIEDLEIVLIADDLAAFLEIGCYLAVFIERFLGIRLSK